MVQPLSKVLKTLGVEPKVLGDRAKSCALGAKNIFKRPKHCSNAPKLFMILMMLIIKKPKSMVSRPKNLR